MATLSEIPRVRVTFKLQKQCSAGDRDAIQMYNVLFARVMRVLKFVQMRRNFYDPKKANMIDHLRLELWPGYVTTVSENEGGLQLVCDTTQRVLRTQTVLDILTDLHNMAKMGRTPNGETIYVAAKKALLGESILTRYSCSYGANAIPL